MSTPEEATHHPGPPPLLWAPSLVRGTEIPWGPGFATWHRIHGVWCPLVADGYYGQIPPDDAILLTPETPTDGAADLAGRLAHVEEMLRRLGGQAG